MDVKIHLDFAKKLDYSPPDGFYGSGAVGGTCQQEKSIKIVIFKSISQFGKQ
jgi:hypothetical protein